jgi:hypothetical protein
MARHQTIIKIPEELAQELDRLAGAKRRSAYAISILWHDIRRARQRAALKTSGGAWRSEDHPELAQGGAQHVEQIRTERDERFESALERQPG